MRIDSSSIGMDSARLYRSSSTIRRTYESGVSTNYMTGSQLTPFFQQFNTNGWANADADADSPKNAKNSELITDIPAASVSPPNAKENLLDDAMHRLNGYSAPRIYNFEPRSDAKTEFMKLHEIVVQNLLKLIFGKRPDNRDCTTSQSNNLQSDMGSFSNYQLVATREASTITYSESEMTCFRASGIVHTADGRDIDIGINLKMTRSFTSSYTESVTTLSKQLIDPLVINLDDAPATLNDLSFLFDMDCDGKEEEIKTLGTGSGFLAYDKNEDGIINDGTELFGTKSGNGFSDLAAYDTDNNGWIDEADEIFDKLKIWSFDSEGNPVLYTLLEKNIGAICLQSADTEFSVSAANNGNTDGYIRQTGIFLYESGKIGTVQHVDLAF